MKKTSKMFQMVGEFGDSMAASCKAIYRDVQKVPAQVVAVTAAIVGSAASGLASATGTTLTVLPTAAATATDTLISAAADVGTILFAIGVPFTLAYLGWKVFHKSSNTASK